MQANIVVERRDRSTVIELCRSDRRNALSSAMLAELHRALVDLSASDVRAVLVHGGDFFCSGFDLQEFTDAPLPLESWTQSHRVIASIKAPIVVCLRGGAINAGAALALSGDVLVASETSYLQVKEAEMGMSPVVNAAWLATRFSPHVGRRLALSCEKILAPELLRMGVASEVVRDDEAFAHALEIVNRLASYPDAAAIRTKGILRAALGDRGNFDAALSAARDVANRNV